MPEMTERQLDIVHNATLDELFGYVPGPLDVVRMVEVEHIASDDLPLRVASAALQRPIAVECSARLGFDDGKHVGARS